ncbi:MAG: hypothetical protein J0I41_08390 [Filimonas sp.]|nr:hypothetical protein [Filimonas sp.]
MSNRLEDFIQQNRNEFDDDVPSAALWARIEEDVNKPVKRASILTFLVKHNVAAAAVIALIAVSAFVLVMHNRKVTELEGTRVIAPLQQPQLDDVDPKYAVTLNRFVQVIQTKQEELNASRKDNPHLFKSFAKDINELNTNLKDLQSQLKQSPKPDEILDAMIQNLQMQTDILNEQLLIIRKIKESKKRSNEKNNSTI